MSEKMFSAQAYKADMVHDCPSQPHAAELEEAVLGAIMLEGDAYSKVCGILKPESFYNPVNRMIYEAVQTLGSRMAPIDMLTVHDQLDHDGNLGTVGGASMLAEITSRVSSAANIEYHARILAQKHMGRELMSLGYSLVEMVKEGGSDVEDILNATEAKLFGISCRNTRSEATLINPVIKDAVRLIQIAQNRENGLSGLPSGFHALDKVTSGWQNSDLIIVAARPAMGKTALVLSMAKNMSVEYNQPIAVFSLEMSKIQLVNRLISNVTDIPGSKIKSGNLSQIEWQQLFARIKGLSNAPLYIDDTPGLSIFELRARARRLVREHGVKMLIIDYLQLMTASGMKYNSREQEVSMISRSLKQLAKELNIPVIALSQLNRAVENRSDGKRPQLSDLRESGAIEQDADIVCFIHRPEYYIRSGQDAEGNDIRGLAEIIIAKHRNGAVCDVPLRFRSDVTRFENFSNQGCDNAAPF